MRAGGDDVTPGESVVDQARRIMEEAALPGDKPFVAALVCYTLADHDVSLFRRLGGNMATCEAGETYAAVVVKAHDDGSGVVNLQVLVDSANSGWLRNIRMEAAPTPGRWHWPVKR